MEPSAQEATGQRSRLQFMVRAVLVVMLLVALVCGVVRWCVMEALAAEKQRQTRRAFEMVWNSLEGYDSKFGQLPYPVRCETPGKTIECGMPNGSGKALYSWRAEMKDFEDSWWCDGPWDQSKPWNDPANAEIASFPWRYSYDALGLDAKGRLPRNFSPETNVLAITGPGTAFGCESEPPASLSDLDGDTILVVEVRNSGVHWMQPGDFDIRDMPRTINAPDGKGISSRYRRGFHVVFADGQVWFVSNKVPFETLARFFTVDGAKHADRETLLQPYRIK